MAATKAHRTNSVSTTTQNVFKHVSNVFLVSGRNSFAAMILADNANVAGQYSSAAKPQPIFAGTHNR